MFQLFQRIYSLVFFQKFYSWHDDREERQRTENSIKQLNHRPVINFFPLIHISFFFCVDEIENNIENDFINTGGILEWLLKK